MFVGARPAEAIPAFARQYRTHCSTCHTLYPQLNEFGRSFLNNNFRIPGQEAKAPRAWERTLPLSFQAIGTLSHQPDGDPQTDFGNEIQLLGGGLLSKKDTFYLHHHLLQDDRSGDLLELWAQHSFDGRYPVNLRLGQFEHQLNLTPEIQLLTVSEYLIYDMEVGMNDFRFSTPIRGLLASGGATGDGLRWWFTVHQARRGAAHGGGGDDGGGGHNAVRPAGGVHPGGEEGTNPQFGNLFLRVQHQSRGRRISLFGYQGSSELVMPGMRATDHFYRAGAEAEAFLGKWRLYGLWLTGRHSNPAAMGEKGSLNGGFAGVDYRLHPRILGYARYDRAHSRGPEAEGLNQGPTVGLTGLVREGWRLNGEYVWRQQGGSGYFLSTRFSY
jgi:hypothetical protein